MITLAIDPSTKSTGWAIFDGKELKDYGCITASSTEVLKRIDKIVPELCKIVEKYKPLEVIVEEILPEDVKHNQKVFKALMYLQAEIALKFFLNYNLKLKFFTSSEWRKKCGIRTGRGIKRDSLKPADMAFVKKYYDLIVNDDVADAICIGYAYTNDPIPVTKETVTIIDGFEFK